MSDLRSELLEAVDEATWEWLMPHARRDALIWVDDQLDLADVGVAIVNDTATTVHHWIAEALIQKPSQLQLSEWNANPALRFKALIVQPYVLIQGRAAG
jgi:hypothetical protein